jgi:aryl-alcohol dehydrogenase-like predicted oxidoreductase
VVADSHVSRLGLGTAQIGMDYGIANRSGQPATSEARSILTTAAREGIGYIDTAPGYGSSEALIGECRPADWAIRTVTKTSIFRGDELTANDGARLIESVEMSLFHLKLESLHAVLLHHGNNLLKPGYGHLVGALREIKARGWVHKIGYSAYTSEEIERINDRFMPDIVQLPMNMLDQRLIASGHLAVLEEAGVEVHIRSVFLQGLLLMDPATLHPYFQAVQPKLLELRSWLEERGMSLLQGALAFVLGQPAVAAVLVGVETSGQLKEIISAVRSLNASNLDYSSWAIEDECVLNPAMWPTKGDLIYRNALA